MTLNECLERKLTKIRKPQWQPNAYLELHLAHDGFYGPWGYLYDQPTQDAIGVESPQSVLIVLDISDDWEEFKSNGKHISESKT